MSIPRKFTPAVFGFILSGLMSLLVSGISTARAIGLAPGFLEAWAGAWITSWVFAFPIVLLVAPVARRWAERLVAKA